MAGRIPPEFAGHFLAFPEQPSYRGVCTYVVDGDTMDCLVDLGFNSYRYITIRLRGVDTAEINSGDPIERARAQEAKRFSMNAILGKHVELHTWKDSQTFGRYVADVYYLLTGGGRGSLAIALREAGHAL
ncbi:MAG: thermonuclease family protein [Sphingosinicella sp.]|nr:thermonuclease family protein [Sphingosinicella sp.]